MRDSGPRRTWKSSRCPASRCVVVVVAWLVGCGPSLPIIPSRPPDITEARRVIEAALGAWKSGRVESLADRQPPIRLVDHDQAAGRLLDAYRVGPGHEVVGRALNFPVEITLRDRPDSAPRAIQTIYQVTLDPSAAVFRNDP